MGWVAALCVCACRWEWVRVECSFIIWFTQTIDGPSKNHKTLGKRHITSPTTYTSTPIPCVRREHEIHLLLSAPSSAPTPMTTLSSMSTKVRRIFKYTRIQILSRPHDNRVHHHCRRPHDFLAIKCHTDRTSWHCMGVSEQMSAAMCWQVQASEQ